MSVAVTPPTSSAWPTATHVRLASQDTPWRMLPASNGFGADRKLHDLPFQTSARALIGVSLVYWNCPTAVHEFAAVHHTALNSAATEGAGLGGCCKVQADPFHFSASGAWLCPFS